ncbi:MAG: sugar phosphate nucleotidyltransferase [Pseudomonadota bacterium]
MNTHSRIHPVILCGGSGTRLWPASRKARPKPFLPLFGEQTLFQRALARVSDGDRFAAPILVSGAQHADLVEQQLPEGSEARLIIEPAARNTAPAIALAAARLEPDAVMLVCPSDHHIADTDAFCAAAVAAAELADKDYLVSFGIAANRPETGYGYIKRGDALSGGFEVEAFIEKPDLEHAKAYIESGEYSWNGGIFAFRAGAFLAELERHRPDMAAAVQQAIAYGYEEGARFHPEAEAFASITGESVDYALMENTDRAAMVPAVMGWSDIGTWAAVQDALGYGADGNIAPEGSELLDCSNVLAMSDGPRISAIGLEDICIVVDGDEVLVTTRDRAQKVGKLRGAGEQ